MPPKRRAKASDWRKERPWRHRERPWKPKHRWLGTPVKGKTLPEPSFLRSGPKLDEYLVCRLGSGASRVRDVTVAGVRCRLLEYRGAFVAVAKTVHSVTRQQRALGECAICFILLKKDALPFEQQFESSDPKVGFSKPVHPEALCRVVENVDNLPRTKERVGCFRSSLDRAFTALAERNNAHSQLGVPQAEVASPPSDVPATPLPPDQIRWEILPPGALPGLIGARGDGHGTRPGYQAERLGYLWSLHPLRVWRGVPLSGAREYLAFEFASVVIAESPDYGNALFHCPNREGWQEVFGLTKEAALRQGAERIIHSENWRERVAKLVSATRAADRGREAYSYE